MKTPPVVRIISHPFFKRYENELRGFYKEPTTPDVDLMLLAINLKYLEPDLNKARAIITTFDHYSLFCEHVHLFVQRNKHEYSQSNDEYSRKQIIGLVDKIQKFPLSFAPITIHILPADSWLSPGIDTKFAVKFNLLIDVLMGGVSKQEEEITEFPEVLDENKTYRIELPQP